MQEALGEILWCFYGRLTGRLRLELPADSLHPPAWRGKPCGRSKGEGDLFREWRPQRLLLSRTGGREGGEKSYFHFPISFEIVSRPLGSPGAPLLLCPVPVPPAFCPREGQVGCNLATFQASSSQPGALRALACCAHPARRSFACPMGLWPGRLRCLGLCCPLLCPKT